MFVTNRMSVDPFIIHGSYPNGNPKNMDFNHLFLQKTFLCMERLKDENLKKTNDRISFDCKKYESIDKAIEKLNEEEKIHKRRMKVVQIPGIIPESLENDALNHKLKKKYWGIVRKM